MLAHYQDAAFLPAAKLAAEIGVSESMVVRFASELGYSGYSHLVREIQEYIKQWLVPSARLRQAEPLEHNDLHKLRNAVLEQDALNLQVTANDYANRSFADAVALLKEAQRIFVVGLHGMAHLAQLCGHLLMQAAADCVVITHGDTVLFHKLRDIQASDVLVVFAYSRYTQRTFDAAHLAHERGARVLTITDALTSPPATLSTIVLRAAVSSRSVMSSHVAGVALIYALTQAYAAEMHGEPTTDELLQLIPASEILTMEGEA